MADITMCLNDTCSLTDCYRKTAKPNDQRQPYSKFKPDEKGFCKYYCKK